MRAVAYSIRSFEKEPLAKANRRKHDITLISNPLGPETATFAEGKEAVIISTGDNLSEAVINKLADLGVKFITIRSSETENIDIPAAEKRNIKLANVPKSTAEADDLNQSLQEIAVGTIYNLDRWQQDKCASETCICSRACDGESQEVEKDRLRKQA